MTTDTTYNGWTNYPTWNIALWDDSEYYEEVAQEIYDDAEPTEYSDKMQQARIALADRIKDDYEERMADEIDSDNGPFVDILTWAMSSVNWHEIAESYMDNIQEEEEE